MSNHGKSAPPNAPSKTGKPSERSTQRPVPPQNAPSTTGKPSGSGRSNNTPRGS